MERRQALKELDKHLKVCQTCELKKNTAWASPSYNRLQNYCNHACATGQLMRVVAEELDEEVRLRRIKKGMIA